MFRTHTLLGVVSALALFSAPIVQAVPFNSALVVNGLTSFDTVNSSDPTGVANQSGDIHYLSGGAATQSNFSGTTISPSLLSSGLTDIGDGVGMRMALDGSWDDESATNPGVFGDLGMSLHNTSATDTLTVVLKLVAGYENLFASGDDAYIRFDISILDTGLNELLFSHRTRDTVFGDEDSDSPLDTITLVLNPGDILSFSGVVKGDGGAFAENSSYAGFFDVFFQIEAVRTDATPPEPVPLPPTLALILLGLAALRRAR